MTSNHHPKPSPKDPEKSAPQAEPVKTLPLAEYEKLEARVAELEGVKEKMLRTAADFENAKKRLVREKEDFAKFAQENLLRDLLPPLDNLERALRHSKEDESTLKTVVHGVEMVVKQLQETLKRQGLQRIETVGQIFDPHRHEIVASLEEEGRDHEIIDEIEPGYFLHGRLLRAAKVRVRVAPSAAGPTTADESNS